jgi:hypothetical protein
VQTPEIENGRSACPPLPPALPEMLLRLMM